MEGQAGVPLAMPLHEGSSLTLARETLSAPGVELPISEIAWIGLVPNPQVLPPDGMPAPGIGVRMRDGGVYYFVPERPDDGERMLDALFAVRPALRQVPLPHAGAFAVSSADPIAALHSSIPFASEDKAESDGIDTADCLVACLAHLSVIVLPVGVPLILWLLTRKRSPYAAQ